MVAPGDVQETVDALMHLAREFEEDDCPLQAIKCYEAICDKNHLTVLPLPEARARLAVSNLLLTYTDNIHRAKTHLETTQMLLRNVHGYEPLKCGTFSGLSRCYRLMGPDLRRQQTDAVQKGLDMSRVAANRQPDERAWLTWQHHFLLEKAQLKMSAGDFRLAQKTLAEGLVSATRALMPRARLVFALAQLQRAVAQRAAGNGAGADESSAAKDADEALAALEQAEGTRGTSVVAMRLHHRVLRALSRLAGGDVAGAAGDPAEIRALVKAANEAGDVNALGAEYRWLPAPAVRALARLLSAEAVRPLGQFADARRELEAAMAECDEALNVLGVLPEGGNAIAAREAEDAALAEAAEAAAMSPSGRRRKGASHSAPPPPSRQWVGSEVDLSLRTGADASPYLAIRLLTLQALVGMDLTACKFEDGANRAECMRAMVEAYPRTLRRTAASADLAEGQVLHSLGRHEEAATRPRGGGGDGGGVWYPCDEGSGVRVRRSDGAFGRFAAGDESRVEPGAAGGGAARGDERGGGGGGEGRVGGSQLRAPGGGAIRHGVRHLAAGRGGAGGKSPSCRARSNSRTASAATTSSSRSP